MFNGFSNNFRRNSIISFCCFALFALSYFAWGFYYERYEPFLTGLFSGSLTPGVLYDHFYFFGHIGFLSLYARLYSAFPSIPWLNLALYLQLSLSFALVLSVFLKQLKKSFFLWFLIGTIGIFYLEHYVFFIYTRVSFLLSFSALFYIIINNQNKTLSSGKYLLFVGIFILALLTRSEPAMINLLLISLFDFIVLTKLPLGANIYKQLKQFFLPGLACLIFIFAFFYDIQNSEQFYKQIEPELEYELMSRNNIVDGSGMMNEVDSFRYQAVFNGMWGDASTNDADFLRSLVKPNRSNNVTYLFKNALKALEEAMLNCRGVVVFNCVLFLTLLCSFLYVKDPQYKRLILFHLALWILLILKSYKVKMVETALSPILLGISILYLYLLFELSSRLTKNSIRLITVFIVGLGIYQLNFITQNRRIFLNEHLEALNIRTFVEERFKGKSIYLNQESSFIFTFSYRPFEYFDLSSFDRVYYFDQQHLTTLEPYRTFLEKECQCDPNNYYEFFSFVKDGADGNIFLMSEDYKKFLSAYLAKVHNLRIEFEPVQSEELDALGFNENNLKAYAVH